MKVAAMFALWLWPLALALLDGLAWFFTGHSTGFVDWSLPRAWFAAAWILLPIIFSPGLR